MKLNDFRQYGHEMIDWMADFLENVEKLPVKSKAAPGDIYRRLPGHAPEAAESMDAIFRDFRELILPGMTHWQSPRFFAYFPANASYPSVLAEMLTATLGAQCMIWETSPAAAELEEKMMHWLREMLDLPAHFEGCIHDTASTATLIALLTARERATNFGSNASGFTADPPLRVYASTQTHSSIDKAVKIAGLGAENLVKVGVDEAFAMDPAALRQAVEADLAQGLRPCCVVATLGTTSSTAIDPLADIAAIARQYGLWLHVDAAYAGTALLLPEMRWMSRGMQHADSFVFNPHKWMFTNFDCSVYFVKDKELLIRTFEILPEYLKTQADAQVNNYRDWGIALGRRFRALKLWFVIRSFGLQGLQQRLRNHLQWARNQQQRIQAHPHFEIMAPMPLNLLCFRFHPPEVQDIAQLNALNEQLLHLLNDSGQAYFTHTKLNGNYVIRWVMGQTYLEERHVLQAWELLQQKAAELHSKV
ncbi:MAG: aminotransferase class I/II-fold pyridoxal phosphate-dependent enzyme [Bacteroidetes bacterium]|nr:MAG: aminotransferase class I/II-fold pyridoxal phosphate-dependent enzyme [Bacteroidota bacterium]